MPNFTLYNLNPEFWARVQAKARAEGTTVKAVILRLLTQWLGVLLLVGLSGACTTPYEPTPLPKTPVVTAPTPPPTTAPTPAPLIVSLSIGRGAPEVGQSISFVASTGTPITRAAWTFGNGATQTTNDSQTAYTYPAVGTFQASVTVTAADGRTGSDQQSVTVSRRAPTPPPPTPGPTPGPNTSGFQATVACSPRPAGQATPCQTTVTVNGVVQPSGATMGVQWDFGDGATATTTTPVTSHIYTGSGTYTVFADVYAQNDHRVVSTTITIP